MLKKINDLKGTGVLLALSDEVRAQMDNYNTVMEVESIVDSLSEKVYFKHLKGVYDFVKENETLIDTVVSTELKTGNVDTLEKLFSIKLLSTIVMKVTDLNLRFFGYPVSIRISQEEFLGLLKNTLDCSIYYANDNTDLYVCIKKN